MIKLSMSKRALCLAVVALAAAACIGVDFLNRNRQCFVPARFVSYSGLQELVRLPATYASKHEYYVKGSSVEAYFLRLDLDAAQWPEFVTQNQISLDPSPIRRIHVSQDWCIPWWKEDADLPIESGHGKPALAQLDVEVYGFGAQTRRVYVTVARFY